MFKYEYVRIAQKNKIGLTRKFEEHKTIIDKYSRKGYRYVGFIPIEQMGQGEITAIDLIFEIQFEIQEK